MYKYNNKFWNLFEFLWKNKSLDYNRDFLSYCKVIYNYL